MNEDLKNKIEEYKKLNWSKLLRKDLGEYSLEEAKPSLDRLKKILDEIIGYSGLASLPQDYQNRLGNQIQSLISFANEIVSNFQNTIERPTWIQRIKNQEQQVWNDLIVVYEYLRVVDPAQNSQLEIYLDSAKEKISELDEKLKTTGELLTGAQKEATQAEVFKYGSYFSTEATQNNKVAMRNRYYMFGSIVGTLFLGVLFLTAPNTAPSQVNNLTDFIAYIVRQNLLLDILVVSLGGYLVGHFSRTYYAEKNLYTLNKQRQNALDSHRQILKSVQATNSENDKEISNAILLELTKAIFEGQDTGYLKNSSDGSGPTQIVDVSRFLPK
ncbi:MAG: hypothetical protein ACYCZZ_01140 [Minisyncoccota bacterium]